MSLDSGETDADTPVFDEIHFTGAFVHLAATHEEDEGHVARRAVLSHKKRTKAEVGLSLYHLTSCLLSTSHTRRILWIQN